MYAQRSRRVKTDRRDALALAEACKLGAYRPAHRACDEQRHVRGLLTAREALVRSRVRLITLTQAQLSREGIRVASGSSRCFGKRVEDLEVPELLESETAPLLVLLEPLNEQICGLERRMEELALRDVRVRRLLTVPEIGALTALSFVATLDEVGRFRGAHQVEAYLGLVPREWSSSEAQRRGRITKAGNTRMRWLLVEAASRLMWPRNTQAQPLREWAERIARRRGRKVAKVALARRLAGILYALWRDGSVFEPGKLQGGKRTRAA
jgi:transposase